MVRSALLLVLLMAALSHSYRDPNSRPTYIASDDQADQMPDISDPEVSSKLRCSACKALSFELYGKLTKLHDLRHQKPRMYEIVEIIEGLCKSMKSEYGLLMRNNKPTTDFSRNKDITRMNGAWINAYIEGRCGEILTSHEEQIVEKYPIMKDLNDFQTLVCAKLDHSCEEEQLLRDEL